jgi:hypothetical protein
MLVVIWIVSAVVGALVGSSKGRTGQGFALGLVLGVFGIVIAAVLKPTPEKQAEKNALMGNASGVAHMPQPGAAWWPDPYRRHQLRYWDGSRWTEHVSTAGLQSTDQP